jgi:hypothetical protein
MCCKYALINPLFRVVLRIAIPGQPWTSTKLYFPGAVASFLGGYLVTSRGSCRVLMLWPNGTSMTAAGTGVCGVSGTGGLATRANVYVQYGGVAIDPRTSGGWLIAEQGGHVVRRILPSGIIALVAGIGTAGSTGVYVTGGPCCCGNLPYSIYLCAF